jgi:hypothetical protein
MKGLYISLLIAFLLVSAAAVPAATLKNTDLKTHVIEVMIDGQRYRVRMLSNATTFLCDFSCALRLVETGQTIAVQPTDTVIISNGVIRINQ